MVRPVRQAAAYRSGLGRPLGTGACAVDVEGGRNSATQRIEDIEAVVRALVGDDPDHQPAADGEQALDVAVGGAVEAEMDRLERAAIFDHGAIIGVAGAAIEFGGDVNEARDQDQAEHPQQQPDDGQRRGGLGRRGGRIGAGAVLLHGRDR